MNSLLLVLALLSGEVDDVLHIAPNLFGRGVRLEVRLQDGTRCDIVTKTHAIEADYAKKWAQAIGQSLHYSELLGKKPGILILKRSDSEWRHLVRVARLCGKYDITLWVVETEDHP